MRVKYALKWMRTHQMVCNAGVPARQCASGNYASMCRTSGARCATWFTWFLVLSDVASPSAIFFSQFYVSKQKWKTIAIACRSYEYSSERLFHIFFFPVIFLIHFCRKGCSSSSECEREWERQKSVLHFIKATERVVRLMHRAATKCANANMILK